MIVLAEPLLTATYPIVAFAVTEVAPPAEGAPDFAITAEARGEGGQGWGRWFLRGSADSCEGLALGGDGIVREAARAVPGAASSLGAALASHPNPLDAALGWLAARGLLPGFSGADPTVTSP